MNKFLIKIINIKTKKRRKNLVLDQEDPNLDLKDRALDLIGAEGIYFNK